MLNIPEVLVSCNLNTLILKYFSSLSLDKNFYKLCSQVLNADLVILNCIWAVSVEFRNILNVFKNQWGKSNQAQILLVFYSNHIKLSHILKIYLCSIFFIVTM